VSPLQDQLDLEYLQILIARRMRAYPHAEPHPETVFAIAKGVLAVIDVSNARPAKYANEPWLQQSSECHAMHCEEHAGNAWKATVSTHFPWLTDLKQPEVAHACLRAMFCLHQNSKGM
jgi:hypothetical protein